MDLNTHGHPALDTAHRSATAWLDALPERAVRPLASIDELEVALGGPCPIDGDAPDAVVARLAGAAEPGLLPVPGPRYFGFVNGGTLPAALAADWLTSAWDQNAALAVMSPAAAVATTTVGRWCAQLLCLPEGVSFACVTGAQMANTTCLAAARHHVLAAAGWDVGADGLVGAPPITVVVGTERHATIDASIRLLGLGRRSIVPVDADEQGRLLPAALDAALAGITGPVIVCAQAGNVNSGAFDPLRPICELAHPRGAWVHVDGAFGLWAAASPSRAQLCDGIDLADSWATDAHKTLNAVYDCGLAFTRHPEAHRAALMSSASYLLASGAVRDNMDWSPEASQRARAFGLWAALSSLGRRGVTDLVDRLCARADRLAGALGAEPGIEVLNDVVFNQVVVRFGTDDDHTRAVIAAVQDEGTCWAGGSVWRGHAVMRLSVSNWSTTEADIDRSAAAIIGCHRRLATSPTA